MMMESSRPRQHSIESYRRQSWMGCGRSECSPRPPCVEANHASLPLHFFARLIADSLIYADDLKERLLRHIFSASAFSEKEIDFNVVSWNR